MEKSTSFSGKDREFGVTVLAGTERVFQKMLSNGRVIDDDLRSAVFLAGTGKIRAILERMIVSDRSGNMLLNAFLTFGMYVLRTDYRSGTQIVKKALLW